MTSSLPALILGGLFAALPLPPPQTAQAPSAVLYRDIGYRGPSVTVSEARPNLDLPWPVRSIRVNAGVWELCQQANFHGRCTRYSASDGSSPSARTYTQSARPVAATPD